MQLETGADPADTAKQEEPTSNGHVKELEEIDLCDDEHVVENGKPEPGDIDVLGVLNTLLHALVHVCRCFIILLLSCCPWMAQALQHPRRCGNLGWERQACAPHV